MTRDRVKPALELAESVLDGATPVPVLADALEALPPRELVRFDALSRSGYSGFSPQAIAAAPRDVWELLALVSADGRERERCVRATPLTPLTARLVAIRAIDWADQVCDAAARRLEASPVPLLVEALPLADQLARERLRGASLQRVLDRRLSDDALRATARAPAALVRRAAWRRLIERGAAGADDVAEAAQDRDVTVRRVAGSALPGLEPSARRRVARILVEDPVGSVAAPALGVLVALEGAAAIEPALTGRSAGARRAARDWAAVHGVDARAVYLRRLARDARDAIGLTALAEIGSADDAPVFRGMLADPRVRIRAAGLRALARVDEPAGRDAALAALRGGEGGRMLWAAADVLRSRSPSPAEIAALEPIALDRARPAGQRLRALSLLRPSRWVHLAALLDVRSDAADEALLARLEQEINAWIAGSGRIGRAPPHELRQRIESRLPMLGTAQQRSIDWVLRTVN